MYMLPIALVQVSVVLYCSFSPANLDYDHVQAASDIESIAGEPVAGTEEDLLPISLLPVEDSDVTAALNSFHNVNNTASAAALQPVDARVLSFNLTGVVPKQ